MEIASRVNGEDEDGEIRWTAIGSQGFMFSGLSK